ncbi:hypothetical protein Pth03_37100 [Planotetraspora thailandica]|uniref:Pentapeptide repeat-containing protein n=1 Tax=Planotetraspora thailandica TaxID=487172 RepID=A0A8J3V5G6_9ACTN|nr:pentapeptide repeat-containing protein [Planotetraspora thailandica]GII55321.1 hypothetical protein Pth03_37100 [Planotetraspora thailandica]
MDTRTVRQTHVTLPQFDDDLTEVASLDEDDRLVEFTYGGARLRELSLSGINLMGGRITDVSTRRAQLDNLHLNSVELSGCDLSGLHWSDSKLSRVVFTDCKLLGAALDGIVLDDVIFDLCKLDYATLTHVPAAGPVIFSSCSLRETAFTAPDLSGAAFDGCEMHATEFNGGSYRDCDLRGNDLRSIRGVASLKKVIVSQPQLQDLAQALAAELEVTFGED